MREIVGDILTWPWFSEPHGYNFNGHLVRDPGGNVCIDPVEPSEDDLAALVREGVAWIVLTNRNHSRAANRVRASTGARTLIHADDADHARSQETELDDALEVGATIGPLEVVDAVGLLETALHARIDRSETWCVEQAPLALHVLDPHADIVPRLGSVPVR